MTSAIVPMAARVQYRANRALAAQGQHQVQRHAHAGQVLEGVGAVAPVGIHHRTGTGQILLALMVIGNHHVHPQRVGKFNLLIAGDAAVHRDHQSGSLFPQVLNGLLGEAVALFNPPGDVPQAVGPAAAEIVLQQHGGGDAVHVVIPEDGDRLPPADGPLDAVHRSVHVPHEHGGEGQVPVPLQSHRGRFRGGDAPGCQHHGQQIRVSGAAEEGNVLLSRRPNVPLFEFHGASLPSKGAKNPS